MLKGAYGVKDALGIRIGIRLTREDMAMMIGTSAETIARLFTEFKQEGIVVQEGKIIIIANEKKFNTHSRRQYRS
jgi:CRP-like cAMP-binding protein